MPENSLRAVASYLQWWTQMGVADAVGDAPCDWLTAPPVRPARRAAAPPTPEPNPVRAALPAFAPAQPVVRPAASVASPAPADWPTDRLAFIRWLETGADVPGGAWSARRVLPLGQPGAPVAVFTAVPDAADQDNGALFCGPAGVLLAAMLGALGLAADDCYRAAIFPTRPPGGRVEPGLLPLFTAAARHHLRVAAPQRMILLGDGVARALGGTSVAFARGQLLKINQDGAIVDAVACLHPAALLGKADRKAAAWASLKCLPRS